MCRSLLSHVCAMRRLLPFPLPQLWQLYCAFDLLVLWMQPECTEWQVPSLAMLFFLLGCGNIYTTLTTWHRKILRAA